MATIIGRSSTLAACRHNDFVARYAASLSMSDLDSYGSAGRALQKQKICTKIVCCHHYQKQALTELPSALELCAKCVRRAESAAIAREFDLSGVEDGSQVELRVWFMCRL